MSEKKEAFPQIIIKDPSASSSWFDKEMAQRTQDAERRRTHQDTQMQMAKHRGGPADAVRFGSKRMITQDAPRLVLHYRKYGYDCVSEVTWVPMIGKPGAQELMFTLVCPRCLERKVPQGEAQLMVRESHRHFWIDDRPEHKRPVMVNMFGVEQQILPAGKVTVADTVRCTNVGCGWAVRITDSMVTEI